MLRSVIVSLLMGALVLTGSVGASAPAETTGKPREATTTLAVLYFDYAGRDPGLEALSKGLAQMLISDLASAEVARVVERDRLQALLTEQKLAQSGKFDPATAARVGKLLGARYLVMGSYFDLLGALRADARLVNVESGQIVKAVGATGPPGDFLGMEQTLVKGLLEAVKALPRPGPAPGPGGDGPRAPKPPRRLMTKTAVAYGRALAAADGGDKKTARTLLTDVLADQPDFALARRDLDNLVQ